MAGYFDAGGGREQAMFEVKSLRTRTRSGQVRTRVEPHSHPQPVLPACPARLLVEFVVPLSVVQGVAPELDQVYQTFLSELHSFTLHLFQPYWCRRNILLQYWNLKKFHQVATFKSQAIKEFSWLTTTNHFELLLY